MPAVESFLNLAWIVIAIAMIGGVWLGVYTGKITASMGRALTAAVMVAFLLLPVISISDDMQVLRKLTEPEDMTVRRHSDITEFAFVLFCLEMLGVALTLLLVLRRLQVLAWPDKRRFLEEEFSPLVGVRPPPAVAL
ncbi:hypothetical protein [Terriglobus tenax]|uniref:hypothetical protein n=1 Tax=Terriglobus tenax TaxID=1111115 RepID=UPI0021E055F2|nr:hypothetical protein [Terriglobus tenax]